MIDAILPYAFNVGGAVRYSQLSRARLYELMKTGVLPFSRIGGRRMIRRQDLQDLLDGAKKTSD